MNREGKTARRSARLAAPALLLALLGAAALGGVAEADSSLSSNQTVTFGGSESSDGTKTYSSSNKLTTAYTASSIAVSRGLKAIYQEGKIWS